MKGGGVSSDLSSIFKISEESLGVYLEIQMVAYPQSSPQNIKKNPQIEESIVEYRGPIPPKNCIRPFECMGKLRCQFDRTCTNHPKYDPFERWRPSAWLRDPKKPKNVLTPRAGER